MLKTIILLPDGTELSSGRGTESAIQSVTITECVNDDQELALGSACAKVLDVKVIGTEGGLSINAGTEVTVYKADDDGERHLVGLFTLEKPVRSSANSMTITAYDRVTWLDRDLSAWLAGLNGWPYSLLTLANMVCNACGLTLANESIPNGDYQVQAFSADGITGRKLMQWVGEAAGRFCRATPEGKIEFAWYEPSDVEITPSGNRFYFQNGLTYEDYQVSPIEKVQIKLTQDDVGVVWPNVAGEKNTYVISGNYLLTTSSTAALLPIAQALYNQMHTVTYTPCKVTVPVSMDIHAGHTVQITERNGKTFTSYIMTKTQTGQRDTLECTGSYRRDSTTVVNNQTLKALSGKMLEIQQSVEGFSVTASEIKGSAIYATVDEFYLSTSHSAPVGGTWSTQQPDWTEGMYLWRRSRVTKGDGTVTYTPSETGVCITGNTGAQGKDGKDGKDGIPGQNGADGVSTYFYVKYSANANGNPMTNIPDDTTKYIGVCSTTATTAPADPSSYEWNQCRGNDGAQGPQGEKGEKGDTGATGAQGLQGEKGEKGETGATTYFHIKYAPVASPTVAQMTETPDVFIGTYVDTTADDSTDPQKYKWARFQGIQGEKGDQGIPGENGSSGLTSYLHIKYSDVANPTASSQINDTGGSYIGQYTDFMQADSTDPSKYTWTNIKGEKGDTGATGAQGPQGEKGEKGETGIQGLQGPKGEQGIPGPQGQQGPQGEKGEKGETGATGAQGPRGEKGDTGAQGVAGADGRTQYLHIKYSDDGQTFTANNGEELGAWIGTLVDFTEEDSSTFSDYTWKKFTEDVDEELENLNQQIHTVQESISNLAVDDDSIKASVSNLEKIVNSTNNEVLKTKEQIASVNLLSNKLEVKIEEITNDGVSKVSNTTGTFNEAGFEINNTDSLTKTQITPKGMEVFSKYGTADKAVLSATSDGVDATNLHAKTYLIVGGRSRFENYGTDRTGCYWIGG